MIRKLPVEDIPSISKRHARTFGGVDDISLELEKSKKSLKILGLNCPILIDRQGKVHNQRTTVTMRVQFSSHLFIAATPKH